jgi:leucyl/phenylalanyl-tRNA--protein transferase
VIAVGGDIDPATLLAGYRKGLFAMRERRRLYWFSPDPRGVLPLDGFHASASLRRRSARFAVSVDLAFAPVLEHCADPSRPGAWITSRYAEAYLDLHNLGWAHSIEVWQGAELAGGLLGVEIGGLFCGETMFHRVTDASKLAVWAAVRLLARAGDSGRVFDVQWSTPHLASLGVVEQSREDYLASLGQAMALPPVLRAAAPLPARKLLGLRAG